MLVLQRKKGQKVQVGEVMVTVLECARGGVKLGFDGRRDVPVRRSELADLADDDRREADK